MDKERYIWIKGEKIPVSEEVYLEYYRPVWAAKKRQEREKRCRTADGNRCMEDCELCDRDPNGSVLSLDKFLEEGYEAADFVEIDELVMEKILLDELYAALDEMANDDRALIDALYYKEQSERDLSKKSGIPRKTIAYRKTKLLERLRKFLEKI